MEVRIIGICPLKESVSESGEVRGYQPLFWVYFPEARPVLARSEAFIRNNNSQRPTFDELFAKRFFNSYIHKESNVYDRSINEYKTGLDALLEAERVKEELFFFEHDMWHY
jgi:gliding motility associated protien GldN